MENTIQIKATVLESKQSTFKGSDGNQVDYSYALIRHAGTVLKITVAKGVDLVKHIDKEAVLFVELLAGDGMKAKLRIAGAK